MKKLTQLLLIFTLAVFFQSCNKDDFENNSNTNLTPEEIIDNNFEAEHFRSSNNYW